MNNGRKEAGISKGPYQGLPPAPTGGNLIQPALDSNPSVPKPNTRLPVGRSGIGEKNIRNPFKK